jgi:hypothetical protein
MSGSNWPVRTDIPNSRMRFPLRMRAIALSLLPLTASTLRTEMDEYSTVYGWNFTASNIDVS